MCVVSRIFRLHQDLNGLQHSPLLSHFIIIMIIIIVLVAVTMRSAGGSCTHTCSECELCVVDWGFYFDTLLSSINQLRLF